MIKRGSSLSFFPEDSFPVFPKGKGEACYRPSSSPRSVTERFLRQGSEYTEIFRTYRIYSNNQNIINSNDVIIDYDKLDKYVNNIRKFTDIVTSIDSINDNKTINSGNDLIHKMALVFYNLNRSIEMGNQSNFYRYLIRIVDEYENNKEKYSDIQGIYKEFLIKCLDRLGYKENKKVRKLEK